MDVRRSRLSLLLVASALALAACGGDDEDEPAVGTAPEEEQQTAPGETAPEGQEGEQVVQLDEFSFDPADVTVEQGATIEARNVGSVAHNFTIERGTNPEEPSEELAATPTFAPDGSERLEVELEPGEYSLVCTVPGHRDAGMIGQITVR